ncbi:MAG: N-acetyltransferase family protein [Pseudonocardiales bacterium]
MSAYAVTVRAATRADAPAIQAIYAPVVHDSFASFEQIAPDAGEITRRMLARPRLPWLVADDAGRVAGYAYASPHRQRPGYRWSAEVSVYLDGAYHRRGIARALYERLLADVTDLGYVCAFAGIALPNEPSVALHEALDFVAVGLFRDIGFKHGGWHDVGWWQRALRAPPSSPDEPREWRPTTSVE